MLLSILMWLLVGWSWMVVDGLNFRNIPPLSFNPLINHPHTISTTTIISSSNETQFITASTSVTSSTTSHNHSSMIASSTSASSSSSSSSSSILNPLEQMTYLQTMLAGAMSRTIAQTIMHPANTYKTLLQLNRRSLTSTSHGGLSLSTPTASIFKTLTIEKLFRGADAQFLLSLPHGAFHFFVIDQVKSVLTQYLPLHIPGKAKEG